MFKDQLKKARINNKMTQAEMARYLNIKNTTISNWEKGISKPDLDTLEKICHLLNVDANYFFNLPSSQFTFSLEEQEFVKKFREIDQISQNILTYTLEQEHQRCLVNDHSFVPDHYIDCYPRLASCGPGEYLFDSIPSEPLGVSKDCKADFAVGINGNSMEPTYYDGQTVLIKKQNQIQIGEIGLFVIDGEAYIKQLGKNKLISHNKNYDDIHFNENMNILCIGKVLGALQN